VAANVTLSEDFETYSGASEAMTVHLPLCPTGFVRGF
jgi:hypothetical protein